MPGNIRLYGTTGYVELAAPATGSNTTLTLPTDSIQPGLVLINKTDFSAASSININNCFSSSYANYRLMINYVGSASSWTTIRMRSGGTSDAGSNYYMQRLEGYNASATAGIESAVTGGSFNYYYSGGTRDSVASYDIFSPARATPTSMTGLMFNNGNAGTADLFYHGIYHTLSNIYDGFTLTPGSGTLTGSLSVYGYRNA